MQFVQDDNRSRAKNNRPSILQLIYSAGPIKRTDIARELDLTAPAITTNVNALMAEGVVRETEASGGDMKNLGRKARPVEIVPESRYFLGMEMRGRTRSVCVTDFRGSSICSLLEEEPSLDYGDNLKRTCAMAQETLERCDLTLADISGVGICVPGLVNSAEGILDLWPAYGWRDKSLRSDTAAELGYTGPIDVENNACARAYGVRLSRRDILNNADTFAYLFISRGIACPFFINTPNAFGSVVGAGEIGHMVMEADGLLCTCGNRGCLEAYSSDWAVLTQCREAMNAGRVPALRRLCPDSVLEMIHVVAAQVEGDEEVCRIVKKAVTAIGLAVANVINFTCPRIMFIDGALFRVEENRGALLEVVRANLCNVIHTDTEFIFTEPDALSGAQGVAALAICRFLQRPTA